MFFWTPYVFVRIVSFFVGGILLGIYQPGLLPENIAFPVFFGLIFVYLVLAWWDLKKYIPGLVGLMAIFLGGYLNTLMKTESRQQDHFIHYEQPVQYYQAILIRGTEEKEKSWKVEARVHSIYDGMDWKKCSGKVLLYFSKQDFVQPFQYGDELLIRGAPQELKGPANPGEFDYKRFLTFRKIYHQHFLREENVRYISYQPANRIMEYSIRARVWADAEIKKHITGRQEQAVASALLLGVKDGLDNDLVQAYSSSGAMHVLAVSGLHVGIIYLILNFFLKPFKNRRHGKWILAILSVLILWSYAFVTGLSASVLRAVTMFSFMSLARPLQYRTNIYNTLSVAAFCLLMWEPYLIMSVGFQLSFLAVIGIVYLQPKLYRLWEPTGWLWDKIWQITGVSIAAQAATFTLSILYFHQFPVYFLFSNLFVIPGAILSLSLGILFLAVSPFTGLAELVGFLLNLVLKGLNFLVFSVERLPFSLIDNIYITTFQSWMLTGALVSIVLLFHFRKYAFVVSFICCGFLFGGVQWQHHYEEKSHRKLVVYHVNGHSAFEWLDKGQSFFFADSTLLHDRERMRFHIRPNRLIHGINRVLQNDNSFVREIGGARVFLRHGLVLLHITKPGFSFPDGMEVDYIVISNNAIKQIKEISSVKFKTLIMDGSNSFYVANKILKEAGETGIDVHAVIERGAFMTKL